ncbi:MAG: hypothetical protein CMF50_09880 [Legionellales bacterium]|nr:hypothetical protein [Legionellales bacterium]|tara:strand:+ start:10577 stop:11914 length:1338 start_codon:yes stop_codon:yes gene_type:complete
MNETIAEIINSQYPNLETRFASVFADTSLSFKVVIMQLSWSTNETEVRRGLHRLHCLLQLWEGSLTDPKLSLLANISDAQKQALVALVLIDSCKGSKESSAAFTARDHEPAKDSVLFLFDTLSKAPDIYPIFAAISSEAQRYISDNIMYMHQRHLLFGEVPLTSLQTWTAKLAQEAQSLKKPFELQRLFWMANLLGFEPIVTTVGQTAEMHGPTASSQRIDALWDLQVSLEQCLRSQNTTPLVRYYEQALPARLQELMVGATPELVIFVARLHKLLADKYPDSDALEVLLANNQPLLSDTCEAEARCYRELNLLAVTFMPAVLWALIKINDSQRDDVKQPLTQVLAMFVKFQRQLFNELLKPTAREALQGHPCVPLFTVQRDEAFLRQFYDDPDSVLSLTVSVGLFISIKAECLKLEATHSSELSVRTSVQSEISGSEMMIGRSP